MRRWILAIVLFEAVLLAANADIVAGTAAPKWDADMFFAPNQLLVGDFARAGRLLLWNPWRNAGAPDCAEPQVGSFSPLTVALGLLTGGGSLAFRVYWLVVWSMGGLGIIFLARQLGSPWWGALAGALSFAFS